MRNFDYTLNEENLEKVAAAIRERLEGKRFAIASAMRADSQDADLKLMTGCTFESSWVDSKQEMVRAFRDKNHHWLGFSAGGYFWSFAAAAGNLHHDPERQHPRFHFDHNGFEVAVRAPCGDLHKHAFRVEEPDEELSTAEPPGPAPARGTGEGYQ